MSDNDDQEFQAAFAEAAKARTAGPSDPHDEPAEQIAAEPVQDQGAEQPPQAPEANQPDIWASAPPELRSAFEAERQRANLLEHQRRSDEGRVAAFQRQRDDYARKLNTFANASKQEDLLTYVQSEDWQKQKKEYGDDLGTLFSAVEALAHNHQQTQEQIGTFGQFTAEAAEKRIEDMIASRASDWKNLLSRPDFGPWLESQPPHVQALYEHNQAELRDPEEVLDLVGKFRVHATMAGPAIPTADPAPQPQPIDQKRAVQLDGSRTVQSRQPVITAEEDDFEGHFKQAARKRAQHQSAWR